MKQMQKLFLLNAMSAPIGSRMNADMGTFITPMSQTQTVEETVKEV